MGNKNSIGRIASRPKTILKGVVPALVLEVTLYAHKAECNLSSQFVQDVATMLVSIVHRVLLELSTWPFACG